MSNIAKTEPAGLQVMSNPYDDSNFNSEMLIIPRVTLLQAMSSSVTEDGAKIGTYMNDLSKENYGPVMDFIPLRANLGAIYFVQGEGFKCRSNDGVVSIKGDACVKCPFGEYYGNWKTGKQPGCKNTIDILGFEGTTYAPCVITFKAKSLTAGKKILSLMNMARKPMLFKLGASLQSNEAGQRFFVAEHKSVLDLSPEQLETFLKYKAQFKQAKVQYSGDEDGDTQHTN